MELYEFSLSSNLLEPALGYTAVTNIIRPAGTTFVDGESEQRRFSVEIDNKDASTSYPVTWRRVGGDSDDIEVGTPKYSGKALKGYTAVWYGSERTALAWAGLNLTRFEFITDGTNALVFGELNQSKTLDYDPFADVEGAFCFNEAYDGI